MLIPRYFSIPVFGASLHLAAAADNAITDATLQSMPNYYVKLAQKTLQLAGTMDAGGRARLLQLISISCGG